MNCTVNVLDLIWTMYETRLSAFNQLKYYRIAFERPTSCNLYLIGSGNHIDQMTSCAAKDPGSLYVSVDNSGL